jgi:hypothetical protein
MHIEGLSEYCLDNLCGSTRIIFVQQRSEHGS